MAKSKQTKQNKKTENKKVSRSAKNGEFVSAKEAKENPDTTVTESVATRPKTSSLSEVAKAWSDKVGRNIAFETVVVKAADGREQTQLLNPENGGSVVVAVNATGEAAEKILVERAGEPFIDDAFTWAEIEGPNKANQVDKADVNIPTPAGSPGAAVEAEKSENADKLAEDRG